MTIQQQLQEQQHSSDKQEPENQIKPSTIIRENPQTKPPQPQDTTIQTSTQKSLAQKTANTENIRDDDKKMQESRMNTQETQTKNTTTCKGAINTYPSTAGKGVFGRLAGPLRPLSSVHVCTWKLNTRNICIICDIGTCTTDWCRLSLVDSHLREEKVRDRGPEFESRT